MERLLAQLSDAEPVVGPGHVCGSRITIMAVVWPDDGFHAFNTLLEHSAECLEHVRITGVP